MLELILTFILEIEGDRRREERREEGGEEVNLYSMFISVKLYDDRVRVPTIHIKQQSPNLIVIITTCKPKRT